MYFKSITDDKDKDTLVTFAEPCESGLFSAYINCKGEFFPCSFAEGEGKWETGIDVLGCNDFVKDIWYNYRVIQWRRALLYSSKECDCEFAKLCRSCPIFDITPCNLTVCESIESI